MSPFASVNGIPVRHNLVAPLLQFIPQAEISSVAACYILSGRREGPEVR